MREGNIYTWKCLSVHFWGGGYPVSGLRWGGTRSQVWWGGTWSQVGGVPSLRSEGGTPSQVQGLPHLRSGGVPHLRSGEYPISGLGGTPFQVRGVPHFRSGWGVPHLGSGVPPTDQHSELLLCGGRYASCVHAGGLSCFFKMFTIIIV